METLKTKKSKDIIMCVVLVLISFFIGRWSVGKNSTPSQNFQKGNSSQARMKVENFGGMIRGVIGSVDDQGLVIKDQDGTSKIILLSSSTTISKSTTMTFNSF